MSTRDYIAQQIRERSLVLRVMRDLSPEQAKSIAAREIASEQRQQRKYASHNNHTGSALYRRLARIVSIMHGGPRVEEPPRNAPIQGELALPDTPPHVVNIRKADPSTPNNDAPVGVWDGARSDGASATWIEDEEFGPRWRDITTTGWRHSIELNERVRLEREAKWARRLAELRGRS
jgi:hypothetical protein